MRSAKALALVGCVYVLAPCTLFGCGQPIESDETVDITLDGKADDDAARWILGTWKPAASGGPFERLTLTTSSDEDRGDGLMRALMADGGEVIGWFDLKHRLLRGDLVELNAGDGEHSLGTFDIRHNDPEWLDLENDEHGRFQLAHEQAGWCDSDEACLAQRIGMRHGRAVIPDPTFTCVESECEVAPSN